MSILSQLMRLKANFHRSNSFHRILSVRTVQVLPMLQCPSDECDHILNQRTTWFGCVQKGADIDQIEELGDLFPVRG